MGWPAELHKRGVEQCNKIEKYAKEHHGGKFTLLNKIIIYVEAKRNSTFILIVMLYSNIKLCMREQREQLVKWRNRLEEQRRRQAAAVAEQREEQRKREADAEAERCRREAEVEADQRKREAEQRIRREEQRKSEVAALLTRFAEVTEPYLEKLAARRTLVLAKDAYGFTSDLQRKSWDKEVHGFLRNAVYPELPRDRLFMIGMSPRDLLAREIDRWENRAYGPPIKTAQPLSYEESCCEVLKAAGWDASLTKETGENPGADIFADKAANRIVVQCQLHATPVGNKAVQEVRIAKNFYTAGYAIIVSASGFTSAAEKLAAASGVKLIHHDQLCNIDGIIGLQHH